MKKTFEPSQQPKSLVKGAAPAKLKPSQPKPIDEQQLRHVVGGASLPNRNW